MLRDVDHDYAALMDQLQDALDEELRLGARETSCSDLEIAQVHTRDLSERMRTLLRERVATQG